MLCLNPYNGIQTPPNCSQNQIEIQTLGYVLEGGTLKAVLRTTRISQRRRTPSLCNGRTPTRAADDPHALGDYRESSSASAQRDPRRVKFWIDECLTPALVGCAHSHGYEATRARDRGKLGMRDDELLGSRRQRGVRVRYEQPR